MKSKVILSILIILLLGLWIPVALEKFWELERFRQTLLRQPFPNAWADILYWLLPTLEGLCAFLLVLGTIDNPKTNKLLKWGFALSSFLMLSFSLFIWFGVLGWYEKRPCGCGSVLKALTWEEHLWFNVGFLFLSVLGLKISFKHRVDSNTNSSNSIIHTSSLPFWMILDGEHLILLLVFLLFFLLLMLKLSERPIQPPKRFPRKFAPFPARPVVETI